MKKPVLAIISREIRRDLQQPLQYFRKFRVVHFWQKSGYGDMLPQELKGKNLTRFNRFSQLPALLARIKPDILQIPEPFASRSSPLLGRVLLGYAHSQPDTKVVVPVFENRPIRVKFGPLVGRLIERFTRQLATRASLFVALNKGAEGNLRKIGVAPEKITRDILWGTWGIDTKEFAPVTKKNKAGAKILFVGKISVAKGVVWLLKAFKAVREKFPQARLSFYGPVKQRQLLTEIERTSGAKYCGIIKNAHLPKRMAQADMLVAPSVTTLKWQEQVGMVNLQALSCAVPVVSTKSGAIPDYIAGSGGCILVPERNEEKLARAMMKILANPPKAQNMGTRGRKWVLKRYEVKRQIAKIEDKLEGVLSD